MRVAAIGDWALDRMGGGDGGAEGCEAAFADAIAGIHFGEWDQRVCVGVRPTGAACEARVDVCADLRADCVRGRCLVIE